MGEVGETNEERATTRGVPHDVFSGPRLRFLARLSANDRVLAIGLALSAFILYLRTLAPGILDGDSGEWQYMASILGVPHSTGYPLYIFIAKAFTLIPLGNPAWRVNLLSAVCAASSLPFLYLVARRIAPSRAAALVGAGLFAVAPTLWASAVEAEVYALNSLLLAVTLYLATRWYFDHEARDLYLLSLTFGLALDNHRVAAFVAPALLFLVWSNRRWLNLMRVVAATVLLLLPLLLYLYIPLRASQLLQDQSAANWQLYPRAEATLKGTISAYYNNTPGGFVSFVTGFDNRNKLGFQDTTTDALSSRLGNSMGLLLEQFNPVALLLAVGGFILVLRRDLRLTGFVSVWAIGIGGISLALHAESTRFYFSGAYMVLSLFIAVALGEIDERARTRQWLHPRLLSLFPLLVLGALVVNFRSMDESGYSAYDTYARSVIQDNLAKNAVVIAPWEIATGLRYLQFVEGQRPDLLIIHESPVRPQFQKLLASAHSLDRAFYYVQFHPEDRTRAGVRTVEAVGLPLLAKPTPSYPLNAMLTDAVRVLGYDMDPDPAMPGQLLRLKVYYQVEAPLNAQFVAGLSLTDIRGQPHGDLEHAPVNEYYPTYFWKAGDYYRDVWDISLPADAPKGLYGFQLSWYPFDPVTNATHYQEAHSVEFGPIRAGDFASGDAPSVLKAEFSNGMTLLGFGLQSSPAGNQQIGAPSDTFTQIQRGQTFPVSLYWQASRPIQAAYTVFVHLEDSSGTVHAQSDSPPWDGMFPTDRWRVGETVRDDYKINVPQDLPPGNYFLRVGLYQTPDKRVPLVTGGGELTLNSTLRLAEQ